MQNGGVAMMAPVDNQAVFKLVDRLEGAWDDTCNKIEEQDLLCRQVLQKADETFAELIFDFRTALGTKGSEILLKTKFIPILEEIEQFFIANREFTTHKEITAKMDIFAAIVKDELAMVKEIRDKPNTSKRLRQLKQKWKVSLEKIDEIMSDDEEEEEQLMNNILDCFDENQNKIEEGQGGNVEGELLQTAEFGEGVMGSGSKQDDVVLEREESPYKNQSIQRYGFQLDFGNISKIDDSNFNGSSRRLNEDDDHNTNPMPSTSRSKAQKTQELQDLFSQFSPQKIRMILKENDLLNRKIVKQRYLIMELKTKIEDANTNQKSKTHRLNRSFDDLSCIMVDTAPVHKLIENSIQMIETELRGEELEETQGRISLRNSLLRNSMVGRHRNSLGLNPQVLVDEDNLRSSTGERKLPIPLRLSSARGQSKRSIKVLRESLVNYEPPKTEDKFTQTEDEGNESFMRELELYNGTFQADKNIAQARAVSENEKNQLMNSLFDPIQRLQPDLPESWRDTVERFSEIPMDEYASESRGAQDPFASVVLMESQDLVHNTKPFPPQHKQLLIHNDNLLHEIDQLKKQIADMKNSNIDQSPGKNDNTSVKDASDFNSLTGISGIEINNQYQTRLSSIASKTGDKQPSPAKIPLFNQNFKKKKEEVILPCDGHSSPQTASKSSKRQLIHEIDNVDMYGSENQFNFQKMNPPKYIKAEELIQRQDSPVSPVSKESTKDSNSTSQPFALSPESSKTNRCMSVKRRMKETQAHQEQKENKEALEEALKQKQELIEIKSREAIIYLKQIEKLQQENDSLRSKESQDGSSSLSVYKLKLENKKLKEAIKKIAGKVKKEIYTVMQSDDMQEDR